MPFKVKSMSKSVTLGEAISMFISEKKASGIEQCTVNAYQTSYEVYLRELGLSYDDSIEEINESNLMSYIANLEAKQLSKTSINHHLGHLRVFVNWCTKNNYLQEVKIKLLKCQTPQVKYYSDEELSILLKKPDKKDDFTVWRTYAITCFILATGARAGTVSELRFEDISFDRREIYYRHLKNKNIAIIPMSDALFRVLNEYIRMWRRTDKTYFFCDTGEGKLTASAIRQAMNKYCKKRNIRALGPHALRHNFAKAWVQSNGNAFALQRMLTHTDISVTQRYVDLFSLDLHQNLETYCPLDNLKNFKKVSHIS